MYRPRALTWVACFLYVSVLIAGLAVASTAPIDPARLSGFACALVVAGALEITEGRCTRPWGTAVPLASSVMPLGRRTRADALAGLVLRAALYTVITALDSSGNAKVLFVLLPLTAYFTVGHRVAYALAGGGLLLAATLVIGRPAFRDDPEALSDLLMLTIGVVFALAIAVIAEREQAGRRRAESLLIELSDAHARLREYADQAVSLATVAERTRMARDIHDTVGHHLVVTAIQLEKSVAYRPLDTDTADRALAEGRNSARLALDEVRRAVGTLRADHAEFTLATSLHALAARLDDPGFAVTLDLTGTEDTVREPVRLALYLAAQEALTNARRHSGATSVVVRVDLTDITGVLDITDNGTGFAPGTVEGQGLTGMRQRLDTLGGDVRITSSPRGTRLLATIPAVAR
ncbi:sensor histidine kinase [Nocardia sp. NPDC058633]|uniref:sensor histidine kinase n=1 Tax=Nocardia sp. NPDC058633 TaxID=3346568 RepID=UPI0036523861